jgi:hypothetical protein
MSDPRYVTAVPRGRWLRRTDDRKDVNVPILAYGMESCVFLIWSDGSHSLKPLDTVFPTTNWTLWEEVG